MKIITMCGSLKFIDDMKRHSEHLEFEGNCVLSVIYPTKDKERYTADEINALKKCHFKKIDISDAIFVVNKNGYIGESVKAEIEYAQQKGKEIMYLENNGIKEHKIIYNKLVRDNIIDIIENTGKKAAYEILTEDNFSKELGKKLIEEAYEYYRSKRTRRASRYF